MLNPLIEQAYAVLDGVPLERSLALALAEQIHDGDLLDLVSLANKVRRKFAGPVHACSILNAKSGKCAQNCRFCAQSAHHHTDIETYDMLSPNKVVQAAKTAWENGVKTFGYVTSGYGYTELTPEFQTMLDTFDMIHAECPDLSLCASVGILSRDTAKLLAEHHVVRYNMNLQTSPARYADLIATTHSIEDKIQTIRYLQEFGVKICCGGIFGLGESWTDRVDMAFAVRELRVDGAPLNVLLPIDGTPLEKRPVISPADAAKAFALFRLVNPSIMLKFAAGRESVMKDFQGLLMLAGMNSMITGGYLTTRGRSVDDDRVFLDQLNLF